MRTIFVRVTEEVEPCYAPVAAASRTSTTFTIEHPHPDYADVRLEFQPGDNVRCRATRLRGPGEDVPRQRMVAVERIA